jgi:hypothetical protein
MKKDLNIKKYKIERLTDKWTDTFYDQISNLLNAFDLDYETEEEELKLVDEVIKEMKKTYIN